MKILGTLLLCLICGVSSARAFIGDNETEVARHYGAPVSSSPDGGTRVYSYQGYRVIVTFEHGQSTSEGFFRLNGSSSFSEETIHQLLQLHAAGKAWQELPNPHRVRVWVRTGAFATYGEEEGKAQFAVMAYSGSPDELIRASANQALASPPAQ